jgi:predicted metal-dependent HD superfamily phosphohydrolase
MEATFRDAWHHLTGGAPSSELFARLRAAYQEPHRAYHNLIHIEDCLRQFEAVHSPAEHPAEVVLALWFHDAVYDPKSKDNEERSSAWAAAELTQAGAAREAVERVRSLILATKHDAAPIGTDAQLLVDIDLSILGRDPATFERYDLQIREEYRWVDEKTYNAARARILRQFLERRRIYQTEYFFIRYEVQARWNLERTVRELLAGCN